MRIDIVTLFPEMFQALNQSMVKRARHGGQLDLHIHQLRQWAINQYGQVDDTPFGGEAGMVLRPEPLKKALDSVQKASGQAPFVVFPTPQGEKFTQSVASELSKEKNILILCGHYKGIDDRIRQKYVHREVSLGDFVLSGGEFPAMVMVDAISRLIPGVLGDRSSGETDSFSRDQRLGWPVFTRPENFEGMAVPSVLLSGHHEKIRQWRVLEGLKRTRERRPELFEQLNLTEEEKKLLSADI